MSNATKTAKRSDFKKYFQFMWRSLNIQASWNYERQMNMGFLYGIAPTLDELYPDEMLYAKIGECHSKALTTEVSTYLMMAVAKMFRLLYSAEPHNAASLFSIEPIRWRGCSDAVMRMSEANVEALLTGQDVNGGEGVKDPACLSMTTESLTREFPLYTPSLLNLVKTSETHVKGLSHEG